MLNARKRRWRATKWRDEIAKYVYSSTVPVEGWRIGQSDDPAVKTADFNDSRWRRIKAGEQIGEIDNFYWLRAAVAIPAEFAGGEVVLHVNVGRQGELFGHTGVLFVDGREAAGLDRHHKDLVLSRRARAGQKHFVAAEVYTGPVESFSILEFGEVRRFLSGAILTGAELRLVNAAAFRLYHDFLAAVDMLESTAEGSRDEARILVVISEATAAIELQASGAGRDASFDAASGILWDGLFTGRVGSERGEVYLIGQSHIDMAWLWRRRETIRKCASTMANTLRLEAAYPFYNFTHSQAQGFQWLKDRYPRLFAGCRRAAKAGRLDFVGGMWVEADLNCAGGEALARQFLYGQRFFQKEFGARSNVGWLVDTFGYNWSLPQIMKQAGIDYFVSTKPTWNDTNTFPFTTFWWEGPDGTRVLTHIPPLTYGSDVGADKMLDTLKKDKEARLGIGPMVLFGKSDGGGGPRVVDLETVKRLAESRYMPRMETTTARQWFDRLPRDARFPVLCDEMYVETHRGTYTSQARTKRNNRKAECALFAAEAAAAAAYMVGAKYPSAEIEAAWKLALFNQFHDILPGSSIGPVYADADADYEKVFAATRKVTGDALSFLASKVDTSGPGRAFLVFNPCAWERTDVVEIDSPDGPCRAAAAEGGPLHCQKVAGARRLAVLVTVPACGWTVVRVAKGAKGAAPVEEGVAKVAGKRLDTVLLTLRLNAAGQIAQLYDKEARREVLAAGEAGNRLQLLEDIPTEYEAWDIDEWTFDKVREITDLESMEVVENGPVRAVVELKWRADKSSFTQRMMLYSHTKRIDFATVVDWRERKTLLKAAFPAGVRSRRATYEIAFAAIDRSTRENNSFDWARFEVPAHKWADLSQPDYGVSLLNDSRYGYDTRAHVMRLSLLRSPEAPDPEADQGRQEFTYSLLPHRGDWRAASTVEEAHNLNIPLEAVAVASHDGPLPTEGWLLRIDATSGAQPVLTAFKKAEDSGAVLVRFYEPSGGDSQVKVTSAVEIASARSANILEDVGSDIEHAKGSLKVALAPFKIATVLLEMK